MAEAVFKHKIEERGYSSLFSKIDSFGTWAWHLGDPPDYRSVSTCNKHGVPVEHSAQQIDTKEFYDFDFIFAMDNMNLSLLRAMKPKNSKVKIYLFGEWKKDPSFSKIVLDPYDGDVDLFEHNFRQLSHFSDQFLESLMSKLWEFSTC